MIIFIIEIATAKIRTELKMYQNSKVHIGILGDSQIFIVIGQ